MHNDLVFLLLKALFFASVNLGLRFYLKLPLISACLAFWFGWIFLLTGGLVAIGAEWMNIRLQSAPYIGTLFSGAFSGFLLATFMSLARTPPSKYSYIIKVSRVFFTRFGKKIFWALFFVGTIFLLQRLMIVGLSSDYLSEVRKIYIEGNTSRLLQVGAHLSVLATLAIILLGIHDSFYGVNIRKLLLAVFCGAPIGLANGGRIFLMSYTLAYLASLLLSRSHFYRKRIILKKRELLNLGAVISATLIIFAIIGYWRGGYGNELNIFRNIIVWPVTTLSAMDSWVFSALASDRTFGFNTFGWLVSSFSRFGLSDLPHASQIMQRTAYYFQQTHNSAVFIPRSILPDLIFDFGPSNLFFSIMSVATMLEIITNRYVGRGIFFHVLSVQCLIASFTTIQNGVVTPGFVATLFYAGVLSFIARHYRWNT